MKTLELNQMENLTGGRDCDGQATSALLATAGATVAVLTAGTGVLLLSLASFFVSWNNLGNCAARE